MQSILHQQPRCICRFLIPPLDRPFQPSRAHVRHYAKKPWSTPHHALLKTFITTTTLNNNKKNTSSDRALFDELNRLTQRQENSQGPFLMPRGHVVDDKPPGILQFLHWSQVPWSERIRRIGRLSRNLVVVSFGGCLALLVIYSITSELFAPASTTNLMNKTITTLEESEKLNKILRVPLKYHTSGIPSQTLHNQRGTIELRFWVESYDPNQAVNISKGDWTSLEWWKSLISPLITSFHSRPTSSTTTHQSSEPHSQSSDICHHHQDRQNGRLSSWCSGLFKLVMPSTFANRSSVSSLDHQSWSDRLFSNHGSFDHGEVIAELIKEPNGQWKYKSLTVDFPDSYNVKYRLDVADELRRRQKSIQNQQQNGSGSGDGTQQQPRYRFWNRRINL